MWLSLTCATVQIAQHSLCMRQSRGSMSAGSWESYGKAGPLLTEGNFLLAKGHFLKLNVSLLPLVLANGIAKWMTFKQVSWTHYPPHPPLVRKQIVLKLTPLDKTMLLCINVLLSWGKWNYFNRQNFRSAFYSGLRIIGNDSLLGILSSVLSYSSSVLV